MTVIVELPLLVLGSTVHVHETVPDESATCFFLSPAAPDSTPAWSLTLTRHVAPGEVVTTTVTLELAATEAGRLAMPTSSGAVWVGVGVGDAWPELGGTVGCPVNRTVGNWPGNRVGNWPGGAVGGAVGGRVGR